MTEPGTIPPAATLSVRGYVAAMVGVALAVLLVAWVMQFAELTGADVVGFLTAHGWWLFSVATVSIGLQSWCSAIKWWHLQRSVTEMEPPRVARLTFYTTVATLLAQILPAPLVVPVVRGTVTRFDLNGSFAQGAAITLYDQIFDVGVLLFVALVCAGLFLLGVQPAIAVASALVLLAMLIFLASPVFALLKPLALTRRLVPESLPGMQRIASTLDFARWKGLDSPEMAALLTRWAVLRYIAIGLRSVAALVLMVPGMSWAEAGWGFGVVQSSTLLALTPGNIGVTEWGWAGIEAAFGVDAGLFVLAILGLRIVQLPATLLLLGLSGIASYLSSAR